MLFFQFLVQLSFLSFFSSSKNYNKISHSVNYGFRDENFANVFKISLREILDCRRKSKYR